MPGPAQLLLVEDDRQLASMLEQIASHRDDDADGTRRHYGIGLALVAEVAAQHGGTVTAAAREDGRPGAAITLELPAAP